jgi:hypothetical protein
MNSKSAVGIGQQTPTYNPNKRLRTPSKESAAPAPGGSDANSSRDPLARLRDLSGCVLSLNPRDPEVAIELARASISLTRKLDELILNTPTDDPAL